MRIIHDYVDHDLRNYREGTTLQEPKPTCLIIVTDTDDVDSGLYFCYSSCVCLCFTYIRVFLVEHFWRLLSFTSGDLQRAGYPPGQV